MLAAQLAFLVRRTASARLPQRLQRTMAQRSHNLRRCLAGAAEEWLLSTLARLIVGGWQSMQYRSLRTKSENLFPHQVIRCGRQSGKHNENNFESSEWWARQGSNL